MCGIVGILQQDDHPIDLGLLEAMTNALSIEVRMERGICC